MRFFSLLLTFAAWALLLYGLFRGFKYAQRRWPEVDKEGRRKIMIAGAIGVVLIGGLLIWRPWESQNYKDCIRAHMDEVDGSPGNRRADLEKYCRESADGIFRED